MAVKGFTVKAAAGALEVAVDGVALSPSAMTVEMGDLRSLPVLTLEFPADTDLEATGLVQVVRPASPSEVLLAAAEWLDGVDPEAVRAIVQGRAQTLRDDPIALTIKVLADAAREAAD